MASKSARRTGLSTTTSTTSTASSSTNNKSAANTSAATTPTATPSTSWASRLKTPSATTSTTASDTPAATSTQPTPPLTEKALQSHEQPLKKPQPATRSPTSTQKSLDNKSIDSTSHAKPTSTTTTATSSHQSQLLSQCQRGCTVVCFTRTGERISGTVFTYSPALHTLALDVNSTYILLNINTISIESVSAADPAYTLPQPPDTAAIDQRERQNVEKRQQQAQRIGVNVSADAQRLFDAFSRTLKCRWSGVNIVVQDSVQIDGPEYKTVHSVQKDGAKSIDRVKKMLAGERVRLGIL